MIHRSIQAMASYRIALLLGQIAHRIFVYYLTSNPWSVVLHWIAFGSWSAQSFNPKPLTKRTTRREVCVPRWTLIRPDIQQECQK
jgi:hypothetical protein